MVNVVCHSPGWDCHASESPAKRSRASSAGWIHSGSRLALGPHPFVKSVGRHDAAPLLKRLAERRKLVHGLRFRVDAHRSPAGVLRPTIHQAPGRRDRLAVLVLGFEDEVGLRRSDIEPWCVIAEFAFGYAEHALHLAPVAPRHGESTSPISFPSRATRAIDSSRSSLT